MKLLILTCNTGGGHNAAARALKEEAGLLGHEAVIYNALSFVPKSVEDTIVKSHIFMYRAMPKTYGKGYDFIVSHPTTTAYHEMALHAGNYSDYVIAGGFDAVLCVHVFPALMATAAAARSTTASSTLPPVYFIATDYSCSPTVEQTKTDGYFIPKDLMAEFAAAGLEEAKLFETGIPVSPTCYATTSKAEARAQLGLADSDKIVLFSLGSMGAGNIGLLLAHLLKNSDEHTKFIVLTGTNQRLYTMLNQSLMDKRVIPVPYTKKMDLYMRSCDVLITKAGGLTSTEALTRRIPTVFMNAVPGLESHNIDFLCAHGLAVTADSPADLSREALALLSDPVKVQMMKEKQAAYFSANAAEAILSIVTNDAKS